MTKYGNKKGVRIREHMHSQLKELFSHDPCVWNPACWWEFHHTCEARKDFKLRKLDCFSPTCMQYRCEVPCNCMAAFLSP